MQARRFEREAFWAYAFIAPPVLGAIAFAFLPMAASLFLSFTRYDVLTPPQWIGLDNYRRLFNDDFFVGRTAVNTVFYLMGVPLGIAAALTVAVLLNQVGALRGLFRTVYFIPSVCSIVAVALVWKWIYRADLGLLNMTLTSMGVRDPPAWLNEPELVKPSLIFMGVWTSIGFNVVVYLAALQTVPRHLIEAAELDGANAWQRFWHVVFPVVSPTTFFLVVTGTIATLQNFDQVYVMTRGGPTYASATFMLYIYVTGFQYFQMGYASAMAWLLALGVLLVTRSHFALAKRWVHE
ncbi:MAG TPA: sugar ABC transporter permease [Polyangiaceae bacterium]|nr:sugar ABC transporter permease [Polyangiaceae bacterium]